MPSVGEYWYDAHGGAEVVRVVEVDRDNCVFLVVNSVLSPACFEDTIVATSLTDFLHEYQYDPEIDDDWFNEGSVWFDRNDATRIVVLESDLGDDDESLLYFRTRRADGMGPIERLSYNDFVQSFVRLNEGMGELITGDRFWVVGGGLCAPFASLVDAQAFVFATCALLGVLPSSIQIHRIAHPGRPLAGRGGSEGAAGGIWLGPAGVPPSIERDGPTLWERLDGDD